MALQGSGQIALSDIQTEFGGSAPTALSEYYEAAAGIPASGEIQLAADFYGTANLFSYTITSNASQVNLNSNAVSAGWDASSPLAVTINSGVTIYSGSTGSYAMVINGSYPGGVTLTNNGTILGRGGAGGHGSTSGCTGCGCAPSTTAHPGGSGGPALQISVAATIVNGSGRISGGGGGGGGGSAFQSFGIHGGGGGAGIGGGPGGGSQTCSSGSSSSLTGAGSGGAGCAVGGCPSGWPSGSGGTGGTWGSAGSQGNIPPAECCHQGRGSGGGAGAATSGASNVTWTSTGTRNGSVG